jgi:hypothetical protein
LSIRIIPPFRPSGHKERKYFNALSHATVSTQSRKNGALGTLDSGAEDGAPLLTGLGMTA